MPPSDLYNPIMLHYSQFPVRCSHSFIRVHVLFIFRCWFCFLFRCRVAVIESVQSPNTPITHRQNPFLQPFRSTIPSQKAVDLLLRSRALPVSLAHTQQTIPKPTKSYKPHPHSPLNHPTNLAPHQTQERAQGSEYPFSSMTWDRQRELRKAGHFCEHFYAGVDDEES